MRKEFIISDENRVTVYHWRKGAGNKSVGHIAMRTYTGGVDGKGYYISWWPAEAPRLAGSVDPVTDRQYHQDVNDEGRPEDQAFEFYSLNIDAINVEYQTFLSMGCKWSLLGAIKFNQDDVHPALQCCSGLVYDLLKKGGLGDLAPQILEKFDTTLSEKISVDLERVRRNLADSGPRMRWASFFGKSGTRLMGQAARIAQNASRLSQPMVNAAAKNKQAALFAVGVIAAIVVGSVVYDIGSDLVSGAYNVGGELARKAIDFYRYLSETDIIISPESLSMLLDLARAEERVKFNLVDDEVSAGTAVGLHN
jgi:hypothetical protein